MPTAKSDTITFLKIKVQYFIRELQQKTVSGGSYYINYIFLEKLPAQLA